MEATSFRCAISILLSCSALLHAENRGSSAPYISGDSFRHFCDHTYDELNKKLNPKNVKKGDTVFVKTDFLDVYFSKIHTKIQEPYILITHNSDFHIPGVFADYLEDPKMIAWCGQNVDYPEHPKLHPIPIGVANRCWSHGNIDMIDSVRALASSLPKKYLLYMNFAIGTYPDERKRVFCLFKNKKYCYHSPPKKFNAYLQDLAKSKFVLCPRGNGLDCHRTWESLLMGAIPVVTSSSLDSMYENLPVLIVENWEDVNEKMLREHYQKFAAHKPFMDIEKMFINYWFSYIKSLNPYK